MKPFSPAASTVNIDVSASSQRVLIGRGVQNVRIMNDGSATAWLRFGDATVEAAVATGFPVGPGVTEVLNPAETGDLYVAAIAAGSTGKIHFTPGVGI